MKLVCIKDIMQLKEGDMITLEELSKCYQDTTIHNKWTELLDDSTVDSKKYIVNDRSILAIKYMAKNREQKIMEILNE